MSELLLVMVSEPQPLAQPWPWPFSSCGSDSNARLSLSRYSILQLKQICLQKRSQKWFCKCRNLKLEYFCASPIYNAAHKPVRHSYGALMSSLFIDEFRLINIESLSLSLDVFCEKTPSTLILLLHCTAAPLRPFHDPSLMLNSLSDIVLLSPQFHSSNIFRISLPNQF